MGMHFKQTKVEFQITTTKGLLIVVQDLNAKNRINHNLKSQKFLEKEK